MGEIEMHGHRMWRDEDGIVHVEVTGQVDVGLAEATAGIVAVAALCDGRRRPVVIDFRELRSMDRAARQYYAGPETSAIVSAAALIVSSPVTRAIGNFMMGLNKPLSPTRMFDDEATALAWLRGFVAGP